MFGAAAILKVLINQKLLQEMAAPKGPAQYAKETQVLWERGPRASTALPWLTYLPYSQLQKPCLPLLFPCWASL